MIVTSDSIVLRTRKQGETSKIATLYTHDFGKLSVIAKGAREVKSKFGGALEMFARTSVVFYKSEKQESGLYLLSKTDLIDSHAGILQSLARIGPAMAIAELLLRTMQDEESNIAIFELVTTTLDALARAARDTMAAPIEFRFYIEFIRLMGFALNHSTRSALPPASRTALTMLEGCTLEECSGIEMEDSTQKLLRGFFQVYFAEHLPGMAGRSMRSGKIFESL